MIDRHDAQLLGVGNAQDHRGPVAENLGHALGDRLVDPCGIDVRREEASRLREDLGALRLQLHLFLELIALGHVTEADDHTRDAPLFLERHRAHRNGDRLPVSLLDQQRRVLDRLTARQGLGGGNLARLDRPARRSLQCVRFGLIADLHAGHGGPEKPDTRRIDEDRPPVAIDEHHAVRHPADHRLGAPDLARDGRVERSLDPENQKGADDQDSEAHSDQDHGQSQPEVIQLGQIAGSLLTLLGGELSREVVRRAACSRRFQHDLDPLGVPRFLGSLDLQVGKASQLVEMLPHPGQKLFVAGLHRQRGRRRRRFFERPDRFVVLGQKLVLLGDGEAAGRGEHGADRPVHRHHRLEHRLVDPHHARVLLLLTLQDHDVDRGRERHEHEQGDECSPQAAADG